jgi:hypothetical protein|tara:strand:+ start:319 stop:558 length:240 start_codon:yes stop_codon:yes gene_type:complete
MLVSLDVKVFDYIGQNLTENVYIYSAASEPAVPEPAAFGLLAIGLLGLIAARRSINAAEFCPASGLAKRRPAGPFGWCR